MAMKFLCMRQARNSGKSLTVNDHSDVSASLHHEVSYRPKKRRGLAGIAVLCILTLIKVTGAAGTAPQGFVKACDGFAKDPVLGILWHNTSSRKPRAISSMAEVPRLSLQGKALATRAPQSERQTEPSLESIFGVSPHGPRELVETDFYQESRAVALSPRLLATVAHAVTLDSVDVHVKSGGTVTTVPLRISEMTLLVHPDKSEYGVPADIAHKNELYDLALVQTPPNQPMAPLSYRAVLSYGTGTPANPTGGLSAGDCVAAIVPIRDAEHRDTGAVRLAVGKVLAKAPVAVNSMTQTKLNVNMFTTDVDVQPGDSGSPVLALQQDQPVLVGLVAATMYPTATFTYITRIDPLLAFANALRQVHNNPSYETQKALK